MKSRRDAGYKGIRSGMWDEIILSGPGYAVFHGRDAKCFEMDGGIEKSQKSFDDRKIMIIYMKGIITCLFSVYR